jgi:hypothetical protein
MRTVLARSSLAITFGSELVSWLAMLTQLVNVSVVSRARKSAVKFGGAEEEGGTMEAADEAMADISASF